MPSAPPRPLKDEDTAKILEQLQKLKEESKEIRKETGQSAIEKFKAALASDDKVYDLFLDSMKLLEFDEADRRASDWREWRQRNAQNLRDKDHLLARRVQLQWLIITIVASESDDLEKVMPQIQGVIDAVSTKTEDMGRHAGILRDSVMDSPFARAYKLRQQVRLSKEWVLEPGDLGGIYDKIMLPYLRENKPTAVLSAWDKRIATESKFAEDRSENDPRILARFKENTLPRLRWERAQDRFLVGDQIGASQDMLALIKENMTHPEIDSWIQAMSERLVEGANGGSGTATGGTNGGSSGLPYPFDKPGN
ncbi:MAG: hypothetical protein R3F11_30275 [Verrucomicrobiales bacterium]